MITIKKLLTKVNFQGLKKGDLIICEWALEKANLDDEVKLGTFGAYKIKNINGSEITVQNGAYFDYHLFLSGKSKLISAILISKTHHKMDDVIINNRKMFLNELRSENNKKGCTKSDDKGHPIFEKEEDRDGHCCCAIMVEMFGVTEAGRYSMPKAMKALGLKRKDCQFIQQQINDNESSLQENADRIENEVFK